MVLYQTDSEETALEVEMFAVLWRLRRQDWRPFADNNTGGRLRGAWFLRSELKQQEMGFIAMAFGEKHGVEPMPPLRCLRDAARPARLCITEDAVAAAKAWLWSALVRRHHPADMTRHLKKECFRCRKGGHLSRYCPQLFATPEAGRYVEPAVAAAVAPARRRRAAPGQGEQKNYHANPTFDGPRCGKAGAEHPGPCYFGENDDKHRCENCKRTRVCAAGNGGRKRPRFTKPKCARYPNCGPANEDGECTHCERKVKLPRSTWERKKKEQET